MSSQPKTLRDAILYFSKFQNCKDFLVSLRWPSGTVQCPRCDAEKVTWLEKARVWKCYAKHESPTFTLKTGTIFEDSAVALEKWLCALWLIVNAKNGISSYEIARALGVSQKSAWHMAHRIRFALHSGSFDKLSGEVEADETYIGGKARNMHKGRRKRVLQGKGGGTVGKTGVQGILERGGEVRLAVIQDGTQNSLFPNIWKNVEPGAHLFTDEATAYFGLSAEYAHQVINHAEAYAVGQIHTNGLENFWSLLKRGLHGTYISVEPFHLFRYLDEQAFRYNNRKDMDDFDRFKLAASQIVGKRLTWDRLTGKKPDEETYLN